MEDKDLWKAFEKTGRVSDYLRYKSLCEGEETVESEHHSDRDDTICDTYW